jgi:hypothetical protein
MSQANAPSAQVEELSLRDRMSEFKSSQDYESFRQTRDNMLLVS